VLSGRIPIGKCVEEARAELVVIEKGPEVTLDV
jgi:hypothetical protein